MIFNINENVRVKLTQHGRELLEKKHYEFWSKYDTPTRPYVPPIEDSEGWSTWQLWVLMQELGGDNIGMGLTNSFETNIEIVEKYESEKLPDKLFEI